MHSVRLQVFLSRLVNLRRGNFQHILRMLQVFEALLGAICQDTGHSSVRQFLVHHWPMPQHHTQLKEDLKAAGLWPNLEKYQFSWGAPSPLDMGLMAPEK